MAAGPLSRIPLAAASVADDLTYVALADISRLLHDQTTDYRIIGGLMVTALAARWDLGASLYRETLDADLGVPPIAARDLDIAGRLKAAGYQQVAGDRFERPVSEVPAGIPGGESSAHRAAIDVLVPAYTSRPRHNVRVGTELVTTEVPGLHIALARAPVELALDLRRLNGDLLCVRLLFPDEVSALALKAFATSVRTKPTDIIDVWRCLEICFAAGVKAEVFSRGATARAAAITRELFHRQGGPGMRALIDQQRLSKDAADQRYTRIRALIARLLPPSEATSSSSV
ncbi:MAG TPA: hypothetical protein VMA72_00240 [Streptosporangiaceae bacterium]|nr:hypothetical protein [Streptosporangiaceae bacterium]